MKCTRCGELVEAPGYYEMDGDSVYCSNCLGEVYEKTIRDNLSKEKIIKRLKGELDYANGCIVERDRAIDNLSNEYSEQLLKDKEEITRLTNEILFLKKK